MREGLVERCKMEKENEKEKGKREKREQWEHLVLILFFKSFVTK